MKKWLIKLLGGVDYAEYQHLETSERSYRDAYARLIDDVNSERDRHAATSAYADNLEAAVARRDSRLLTLQAELTETTTNFERREAICSELVGEARRELAECGNKVKYESQSHAHRVGLAICRGEGDMRPINAYHCPHCNSFHWGHRRK